MAVTQRNAVSGSQTSSNTAAETITLPTYSVGDTIIMIVARNQASTSWTGDANVAVSALALGTGRLSVLKLTITGSPTTFVLTSSGTNGIWRWWLASYYNVSTTLAPTAVASDVGNSTTSVIPIPPITHGFISSADSYVIRAAGVNSTATWTTDGETLYNNTTGNASILVAGRTPTADRTAESFADIDRGNNTSSRYESAVSVSIPGTDDVKNYITNASYELGSTIATGWEEEHTTAGSATHSLVTSGQTDGLKAQRIVYTGVGTDDGTKRIALYQAPITGVSPGDVLTFNVYLSGTLTDTYAIIGIEAFEEDTTYISEHDTVIPTLDGTPTKYSVSYTCPALTSYVAAYFQSLELDTTSAVDVVLDSARLTKADGTTVRLFGLLGIGS